MQFDSDSPAAFRGTESDRSVTPKSGPPTTHEHWTENLNCDGNCANCGEAISTDYCGACGQRVLTERLGIWGLVREVVSRLTNVERGLLHTFLSLLKQPGDVAKDYCQGKQRPYVNPLTYFFIGAAMQIMALWLTESTLEEVFTSQFTLNREIPANEEAFKRLEELLGQDAPRAMAQCYLSTMKQAYTYAALLFFCVPFAIALKLLHHVSGERFRLGETTVFSLYTVGQMLVISAMFTPIASRISVTLQGSCGVLTYIFFAMHGHTKFFRRTWLSRFMTLVSLGGSLMIFFLAILGIFIASFIMQIIAAQAAA